MPKLKTNSGAKKRFKVTKNGKVLRAKGYKSHLLEAKASKQKTGACEFSRTEACQNHASLCVMMQR